MDAPVKKKHSTLIQSMNTENVVPLFKSDLPISALPDDLSNIGNHNYYLSPNLESQRFLFKSTTENINDILEPEIGSRPLDSEFDPEAIKNPDALADQIVTLSVDRFALYMESCPDLTEIAALERFINLISEGVTQATSYVREVFDCFNLLDEEVMNHIDDTHEQILEGLEEFGSSFGYSTQLSDLDMPLEPLDSEPFIDEELALLEG